VDSTLDQSTARKAAPRGRSVPGLLLVFAAGKPTFRAFELGDGAAVLGREGALAIDDPRLSRRHAEVTAEGGRFTVRDLGSRNGSFRDGIAVAESPAEFRVLRMADSLLIAVADLRPFSAAAVEKADDVVLGPQMRTVFAEIVEAARSSETLHITGETGTGKELAARAFHQHGGGGPFVGVNCAGIPTALAERLLFGARRGAYSGADADAEGHLQAADGGTLFLDEVAELSLEVQAKLLRVLETREVVPLGAQKSVKVKVRICSATHGDLSARVAAGQFRQDLYYRLGLPRVELPALRDRLEEVPWLIAHALERLRPALAAHVSFVEAALLRPWPGNIRELLVEVADAARRAAGGKRLEAEHLAARAGLPPGEPAEADPDRLRAEVERALSRAGGNISQAARTLGMHRTQLRRYLGEAAIDPARFKK
jgi:DNA-binding NtrC family response regulator